MSQSFMHAAAASFDAWRYFRKYGKQQTLLERIQEMQAEALDMKSDD
jgi:hypothetical protein